MPRCAALPALCCLTACTWFTGKDRVLITSDPAGAHVAVDGTDMHVTTPSTLAIGGNFGFNHVVTISKPGYREQQRTLYQYTEGYTSKWIDGAAGPAVIALPVFWTAGDFFFPFGVRGALVPGELHVKLYRVDEPLLGWEVLSKQSAMQPQAGVAAPAIEAK